MLKVCAEERKLFPVEPTWTHSYGTAGFRDKLVPAGKKCTATNFWGLIFLLCRAEKLDRVLFRMGLLSVLRSKVKKGKYYLLFTAINASFLKKKWMHDFLFTWAAVQQASMMFGVVIFVPPITSIM